MVHDPIVWDRGDPVTDPGEPVTAWLVARIRLAADDRLLEIAGGSGVVSSAARDAGCRGHLVCSDIDLSRVLTGASREASDRADARIQDRRRSARIDFLAADMQRLPFADRTFKAIVCRWGLMFASDPLRAFREARRVLRRGGRLVFAVWGPAEENPWQTILDGALEAFGIERRANQRAAGGMFGLADAHLLPTLLADSDLPLRELERIELLWRYRDLDDYWSIEVDTGGERSERLRALGPAAATAFRGRLERDLSEYWRDGGFVLPAVTVVVAADA